MDLESSFFSRLKPYQSFIPIVLRATLGAVFLLFGIDKFRHPDRWVYWVPQWVGDYIDPSTFIFLGGIFETLIAVLLISGLFTRLAALASALFFISVLVFIGADDTTTRDIGLLGEALALILSGGGKWSLDGRLWASPKREK